jgi:hypothetical protein
LGDISTSIWTRTDRWEPHTPTLLEEKSGAFLPTQPPLPPKEETLKESDPTSKKSSAEENPSENPIESKSEHPKGTLTAFGGRAEAEEAIAERDPKNTETGPKIAGNDIPGNTKACTGEEAYLEMQTPEQKNWAQTLLATEENAQLIPTVLRIPQKQEKRDQQPKTCSSKSRRLQEERTEASQEYIQHL